jgi:hypothetical protein
LIRPLPQYRRDVFVTGLQRAGFAVEYSPVMRPRPGDVLVIWNRYGQNDIRARAFEAAGVAVIVAENGYLPGPGGSKTFALSRSHHNGAGSWPVPDGAERCRAFGFDPAPWRLDGSEFLLLPQRGIGPKGIAMPRDWLDSARGRLVGTGRRIRVRAHPGNLAERTPVTVDLSGVYAAVTWGSGAALKALLAGVPVFYDMPTWIGAPAAARLDDGRNDRFMGDRTAMFERLACAQWTPDEVASGEPFVRLAA